MFFLFVFCVCQTASIFYSVAFQILWPEIFFPHSWSIEGKSSYVTPSIIFEEKNRKYFCGRCRPRKLKSGKNNRHVFETKPRKFGDAKISHYTVTFTPQSQDVIDSETTFHGIKSSKNSTVRHILTMKWSCRDDYETYPHVAMGKYWKLFHLYCNEKIWKIIP